MEQQKENKMLISEDSLKDLWDNIKQNKICILGDTRRRKEKERAENPFEEIMAENFPNLEKEKDIRIQEAQKVPNEMIQKDQHQDTL